MSTPMPATPHTTSSAVPRWATIVAVALGVFFTAAGLMRLLPVPFDMAMFASWGLPAWLRAAVGVAELTAGLLLLIRRTRPIGAIGVFTIMVSAGTTHAVLGHGVDVAIFVNGIPALLAATAFWTHRRQLAAL